MLIEEQNGNFAKPVLGAVPSVVYNEDCVEGMKRFPDKYFDLAVVDPPYGLDLANMNMGVGKSKKPTNNAKNSKNKNTITRLLIIIHSSFHSVN